jgi:hypothetical protein
MSGALTQTPARAIARRAPYRAAALASAALAADVAFDPVHRHVPLCPFHAVTGAWCPLCGGLRAADSLAHLQFGSALHDNLLFVAALPFVLVMWIDWVRTGRALWSRSRYLVPLLVVLAVVFTVVRNLPFAGALRPA